MITTKKNTNFGPLTSLAIKSPSTIRNPFLYGVTQAGTIEGLKGYSIFRKNYEAFAILYCHSGQAELTFNKKTYLISSGDLVFFNQSTENSLKNDEEESFIADYMYIYGSNVKSFFDAFYKSYGCVYHGYDKRLFCSCVEKIKSSIQKKQEEDAQTSLLVFSVLMDLYKLFPCENASDVSSAIEFLTAHYNQEKVLDSLYKRSYLSKYHFIRKFHKRTGYSPKEFLDNVRFEKITELMRSTELSFSKISELCSIKEHSLYFLIKKRTGLSPTEYKKSLLKKNPAKISGKIFICRSRRLNTFALSLQ